MLRKNNCKGWEKIISNIISLLHEREDPVIYMLWGGSAKALGKKAACLLTISDSFVNSKVTTAEERQKNFTDMMKVALELAGK